MFEKLLGKETPQPDFPWKPKPLPEPPKPPVRLMRWLGAPVAPPFYAAGAKRGDLIEMEEPDAVNFLNCGHVESVFDKVWPVAKPPAKKRWILLLASRAWDERATRSSWTIMPPIESGIIIVLFSLRAKSPQSGASGATTSDLCGQFLAGGMVPREILGRGGRFG